MKGDTYQIKEVSFVIFSDFYSPETQVHMLCGALFPMLAVQGLTTRSFILNWVDCEKTLLAHERQGPSNLIVSLYLWYLNYKWKAYYDQKLYGLVIFLCTLMFDCMTRQAGSPQLNIYFPRNSLHLIHFLILHILNMNNVFTLARFAK